jgi:hypothetical protein
MRRFFVAALLILTLAANANPTAYVAGAAIAVDRGGVQTVWSTETPTAGNGGVSASQAIALVEVTGGSGGTPFGVDGKFSAAPGVFEVDVQVANNDADTNYQTCSNCNITTVDATNNTFHLDGVGTNARFVRLLMRTRTNSVSITASIKR